MSCGCGCGGNSATSGALLTGTLDPRYATQAEQSAVAESDVTGGNLAMVSSSSLFFWIALAVVIGIAWHADKRKGE